MQELEKSKILKLIQEHPFEQNNQELGELARLGVIPEFLVSYIELPIRLEIANNLETHPSILSILAEDKEEAIVIAIASNPSTPSPILIALAKSPNLEIRFGIAGNPNAPREALEILADDIYERVRKVVIDHPNVTPGIINQLSELLSPRELAAKKALAAKRYAREPQELEILLKSRDVSVRLEIAKNPQTPTTVLEKLEEEQDLSIKMALAHNPQSSPRLLFSLWQKNTDNRDLVAAILNNPQGPVEICPYLERHFEELAKLLIKNDLARVLCRHPKTPLTTLELLVSQDFQNFCSARFLKQLSDLDSRYLELLVAGETEKLITTLKIEISQNPEAPLSWREALITPLLTNLNDGVRSRAKKALARMPQKPSHPVDPISLSPVSVEIRRQVAGYPGTPTEILAFLAQDEDAEVRCLVAIHEQTSPETLASLRDDLLNVRLALVKNTHTPREILEQLATSALMAPSLLDNPSLPPVLKRQVIENCLQTASKFPTEDNLQVCVKIALDPNTPPDILEILAYDKRGTQNDPTPRISLAVARNPQTPLSVIEAMSQCSDTYYSTAYIANPRTPPELLLQLAQHSNPKIRTVVAAHPNTPTEVLVALYQEQNRDISLAIARNPQTPLWILEAYSNFQDLNFLAHLCDNPRIEWSMLEKIYRQANNYYLVNQKLANHPHTPPEILDQLANFPEHETVKKGVANNPNTWPSTLEKLSRDIYVSSQVINNPRLPISALNHLSKHSLKYVLNRPDVDQLPPELLKKIPEWQRRNQELIEIGCYLAIHPHTSPQTLEKLSKSPQVEVRKKVIENPNIAPELLEKLAQDKDFQVRQKVAASPQASEQILARLAKDKKMSVRIEVAKNNLTPRYLLQKLVLDPKEPVRLAVLKHQNTLPLLLTYYAEFGSDFTRLIASLSPHQD